jgi:DNA-directed RNA polymerase subunit RPC12/RpoP
MDIIFKCPKCEQELEVDSAGAGSEIDCPSCGEKIVIPGQVTAAPPPSAGGDTSAGGVVNPMASSAAAKIEMHLKVPMSAKHSDSLIAKPLPPLEVAAKGTDKTIHVKTIRHTDCIEVGHDRFDEIITNFLTKVGQDNIVSITPLNYTHLDIGTQKLLTEYGVLIVYKG